MKERKVNRSPNYVKSTQSRNSKAEDGTKRTQAEMKAMEGEIFELKKYLNLKL